MVDLRIYYTFGMQLTKYYKIDQREQYLFMLPLTIAGFLGTLIFVYQYNFNREGQFFDTIGRRTMITFTYITSGLILILIGITLIAFNIDKYFYVSFYFFLFLIASPGASSAHLTVSELFPSVISFPLRHRKWEAKLWLSSLPQG